MTIWKIFLNIRCLIILHKIIIWQKTKIYTKYGLDVLILQL